MIMQSYRFHCQKTNNMLQDSSENYYVQFVSDPGRKLLVQWNSFNVNFNRTHSIFYLIVIDKTTVFELNTNQVRVKMLGIGGLAVADMYDEFFEQQVEYFMQNGPNHPLQTGTMILMVRTPAHSPR